MNVLLLDSGLGLFPFIYEILKKDLKNTYYLYMDNEYFPYGDKTNEELKNRLMFLLNKFKKLNLDLILICCNTLSYIYKFYNFKYDIKIKTILDINLSHLDNNKSIIVTPSLKNNYKYNNSFICCKLAKYIQNKDILNIIKEIKLIKKDKDIILGCTHYPLIKNILKYYFFNNIYSYEADLINELIDGEEMEFYVLKEHYQLIKDYFYKINIFIYSLT